MRVLMICLLFNLFAFSIILDTCYGKGKRDEIIEIIKRYEELNDAFLETGGEGDFERHTIARRELEDYFDNYYLKILTDIEKMVCEEDDSELLLRFFVCLTKTGHSANPVPPVTLANIYLCRPELTLESIKKLGNHRYLVSGLKFGFMEVSYRKKNQIEDHELLLEKVETLFRLYGGKDKAKGNGAGP